MASRQLALEVKRQEGVLARALAGDDRCVPVWVRDEGVHMCLWSIRTTRVIVV